ncbi:hypothetical protein EG834_06775, partial [bacterium]|nr:hypothetical protein [bacterium]
TITLPNISRRLTHPLRVQYCASFWSKFCGLMLRQNLTINSGALLVEDKDSRINASIHMLFMRFDIAAIWINSDFRVVDVQVARRWRLAYLPAQPARFILEAHVTQADNFQIGDQVTFTHD